jgi:octaprenyl-diphosphate synthase
MDYDSALSRMAALCSMSEHCESEIRQKLQRVALPVEDIDRLIDFAKRAGGIDYAYETMGRLRDEANDVLSPYSPDETVDLLREIFDYVIERKL